ncbi:MAG: polysaccharide lyase family 7 protein [Marinoscillum sp.]
MKRKLNAHSLPLGVLSLFFLLQIGCSDEVNPTEEVVKDDEEEVTEDSVLDNTPIEIYPSEVFTFYDEWRITMGNGDSQDNLINFVHPDYFYGIDDGTKWVIYKTPNSGGTTANSSNTRSELRQVTEWTPSEGGKLSGTLKVMHVSTTADARVPASFSVVVGQIHSDDGHENEPLKIFYKKFPGHTRGSVFWNYEINTSGDNSERWDYSTAVWGHDWSEVGATPDTYPEEPTDGIELGEEFSYEVNVYEGVMYLTFTSEGHETQTFTKSLISSEYTEHANIPNQVLTVFASTGQDGVEVASAYAGEQQYFKQGAYNQTNGKTPDDNMIWSTGAETYGGSLSRQYENGSYTEVWFREAALGPGTKPQ